MKLSPGEGGEEGFFGGDGMSSGFGHKRVGLRET